MAQGKGLSDCKQGWDLTETGAMHNHVIVPLSFGDATTVLINQSIP